MGEAMMQDPSMQERGRKGNHFSQITGLAQHGSASALQEQWDANARRVPVPAGALLLWSSRTLHQGWVGGPRLAQPVCWEPIVRRSEFALERKLRLAALGLPSTHWASLGIPHTLVNIQPAAPSAARTEPNGVALTLASTIRPVTLAAGVDVQEMWKHFQAPDWEKPLPHDLKELFLRSI